MDRYPSVFGSEREAMADVLREIVRKRDNDVTDFQDLTDAFNIINTASIQAIAALTPAADMVPYFDSSSTAGLLPVTEPGKIALENEFYTIFESDFLANTTSQMLATAVTVGSGTISFGGADINHWGVAFINSSATVNSGGRVTSTLSSTYLAGGEQFDCIFRPTTLTNSTHRIGFHDATTSTDAVDGCYFEMSASGAVIGKTANNSTRSSTSTIATLTGGNWYHGRVTLNSGATLVTFEIFSDAGALLGSSTLNSNIPSTSRATGFGYIATESAGATQELVRIDYMRVGLRRKLLRGAFQ